MMMGCSCGLYSKLSRLGKLSSSVELSLTWVLFISLATITTSETEDLRGAGGVDEASMRTGGCVVTTVT